jgi:hypothetical protein
MKFSGGGWTLSALGAGAEGPLICRLNGPEQQHHAFTLIRATSPPAHGGIIPTADADAGTDAP